MFDSKEDILKAVLKELQDGLAQQQAANEAAAKGATDSESRAETKWDTGGLEASYLARGYAKKYEELVSQLEQLKSLELSDFTNRPVGIGALIECDLEGYVSRFFLLPCCGGLEVETGEEEVTVITPESPVGKELSKKMEGNNYMLPNGRSGKILSVR